MNTKTRFSHLCPALLAASAVMIASGARAQPLGPNTQLLGPAPVSRPTPEIPAQFGDGIIEQLGGLLTRYSGVIGDQAFGLLIALLVADLVINTGRTVMTNSSIAELLSRFAFRLLFVAFSIFIIRNIVAIVEMIANAAVRLARLSAEQGSFVEPTISGIISDGLTMALNLISEISIWEPLSVFYVVSAVVMLVITAVMVALIIAIYAELYLSSLAGLIVMGFAGLESAKDSAVKYIRSVIGKGLNLLTLLIVFSLFTALIQEVAAQETAALGADNVAIMLILQVVSVLLMLSLPGNVENLAGGIGTSIAGRVAGGAIAAVGIKAAINPVMGAVKAAAAGAVAGGVGAAAGAARAAGSGGGTGQIAKGAASGAGQAGGRYARAAFSKTGSVAGEALTDIRAVAGQMKRLLNRK